jgi:hypothetical protein
LADGDITETKDFNGLTIVATSDKKVTVDASKKTFDDVEYTKRLKLNGSGTKETRHIAFNVPGDATITIHFAHSSSSGDPRTLNLDKDEFGATVTSQDVEASSTASLVYNYTGGATKFYAYSKNSGLNLYAVIVKTAGDDTSSAEVWDASTADLETIAANPVDNANPNFFSVAKEKKIYPTGTFEEGSTAVVASDGTPITLKNYILTAETASIKMTAISTPNSDASANQGWQLKANGGNAGLNTDDCVVKFEKAIAPKNGNPSMGYKEYYEAKSDGGEAFRVQDVYWTPETKQMPLKGLYYEFETKAAGELLIGIRMNRETDQLYVFTKDDFAQLPTSALSIEGFVNNNTVVVGTNEKAMFTITMTADHNYSHGVADKTEDYIEGFPTSKAVFGYLKLNVEANKTYVMLSPKAQPAIFGFQFTPGGDPSGVETIKVEKVWNADAPMYNLSGQQVDKSYKGIVIQNGRKFVNK